MTLFKPTPDDLVAARHKLLPDVLGPNLKVLFCGINPSLYSAAVGYHFARPGNRFWPTLFAAGFTDRRLLPSDQAELRARGYGLTNVVRRATAAAAELSVEELQHGGRQLISRVRRFRPKVLAILGMGAYRSAWNVPRAKLGRQPETIATTGIWVLPNPSGLNAHYLLEDLAKLYRELREGAEASK